jgi:hypothetical protein
MTAGSWLDPDIDRMVRNSHEAVRRSRELIAQTEKLIAQTEKLLQQSRILLRGECIARPGWPPAVTDSTKP